MENSDALGSSTAPLTWHDFLERMRQPSASDFVKAIKSFIVSFSNNAPDPEKDSAAVQQFLTNMEAAFRAHPLWAGCSEDELESAGEGLEKYVMTKLFTRVFASLPDDVKLDENLYEKMALIQQFIRPENLDIKPAFQNETSWLLAQKELQKINMYKAPRDKLVCILNCCKVINNILFKASIATNENPPGADEFLPVLIYVTIKANPPQLHSNLLYIQRFRHQSRLVAEAAYLFTNMLSAESFISNLDAHSLSMEESEFETNMESARALLTGLSGDFDGLSNPSHQKGHIPKAESMEFLQQTLNSTKDPTMERLLPQSSELKSRNEEGMMKTASISDLENKGATLVLKEDQVGETFRDYPYLYARVGDLTISDVEELLNNYKQLVCKYVCLSKGMGGVAPPLPPYASQAQTQSHAEDVGQTDDNSANASLLGAENLGSKLAPEDVVAQQGGEHDEVSE